MKIKRKKQKADATEESNNLETNSNGVDYQKVKEHPEKYLEINMINKNRVVETFYIYAEESSFTHGTKDKTQYKIEQKAIYQFPKKNTLIPTAFYKEGNDTPIMFQDENKGITCRALSLLYDISLYRVWMKPELKNYNIILIILIMINLIFNAVMVYSSSYGGVTW